MLNQTSPSDPYEDAVVPAECGGDMDPGQLDLSLDLNGLDQDELLMSRSTTLTGIYEEHDNLSFEHDEEDEVDIGVEGTSALDEQQFEDDKVCMV